MSSTVNSHITELYMKSETFYSGLPIMQQVRE